MKLKKFFVITLYLFIFSGITNSAEQEKIKDDFYYTGNPKIDLFSNYLSNSNHSKQASNQDFLGSSSTKSPLLAGGMSLLIPGAGEIYSESYIKGGIFLAAEVAAWVFSLHYEKKGDDQNALFEKFADERYDSAPSWYTPAISEYMTRWDVARYSDWSFRNKGIINNKRTDWSDVPNPIITADPTLPPWERVDWTKLNELERAIGNWYSHTLPKYGEQQYYELIGKYPQYNQGWWDANNDNYTYGDPITETFKEYSKMRGLANDYYYKARTAITVVVANHVLSAIDAFFTAKSYNSKLKAEMRMEYQETPFGSIPVTFGTLKYEF